MLLGKFIALKFIGLRHWPLGAAYALVLVALIVLLLALYLRLGGSKNAFQAQHNEGLGTARV
jgi:ABC-type spermidine/putrescine transport system permease subunit I